MDKIILLDQIARLTKNYLGDITKLINTSVVKCNTCGANKLIRNNQVDFYLENSDKKCKADSEIRLIEGDIYAERKD